MGIAFWVRRYEPTDASWSYGGFNRFRKSLAALIGIDLETMAGFTENGWSWDGVDDPIKGLLHHSDCDGDLDPDECRMIYPRLMELVESLDDDYDRMMGRRLAAAMEKCAGEGLYLGFM